MTERDILVLKKAFPLELRHVMYLLTTKLKPVQKSVQFLEKSIAKSLTESNSFPYDLSRLIGILQKTIILPELDEKGKLTKAIVFLSISKKLRQNLLLFLRSFKTQEFYFGWIEFVRKHYMLLDDWSKVIFRSDIESTDELNIPVTTTTSIYKNKLKNSCTRLGNSRPFFTNNEEICSPPSKRRKTDPNDNLFDNDDDIDENEMISVLDKTVNEFMSQNKNVPSNGGQRKPSSPEKVSCETSNDNIHTTFTRNNLNEISLLRNEKDLPKLTNLFLKCPLEEFRNVVDTLNILSWPEGFVQELIKSLIENDALSFEKMKVVVFSGLTNRLKSLSGSIPRNLHQNIIDLMNSSRRLVLHAVILEVLLFENFDKNHEDLVNKFCPLLNGDDVNFLLDYSLKSKANNYWNESFLATLDILLERKSDLSESLLKTFVMKLSLVGSQFKKSLKLMKLLITILRLDNGKNLHNVTPHLRALVEQNETFLKKRVLSML